MLLIMTPLTGYGFVEATRLFGEASGTALQFPELARGMAPLDGIQLTPTGTNRIETSPGSCTDLPISPTVFPTPGLAIQQAGNTLEGSFTQDDGSFQTTFTYRITRLPDTDKDGIPNDADATPVVPDVFVF